VPVSAVLLETRTDELLVLTLNRPAAANALDSALQGALVAALAAAAGDADIRAVVLTAAGERNFSAGADLKEWAELERGVASRKRRALLRRTLLAVLDFPKPLVAAVQGRALGAGCMLALLADEVVAVDTAQLGLPEIKLGMPTPLGFAVAAARAGSAVARRLVQTGAPLAAGEALAHGLIDEVTDTARLAAAAQARGRALAGLPGHAYRANKSWINRALRAQVEAAVAEADRLQGSARDAD
jgi:enoyl-CoA hydratase/carnithine racemase